MPEPDPNPAPDDPITVLENALGGMQFRFWTCPTPGHSDHRDPAGDPVVTVEWDGDVARCTAPGCTQTSETTHPQPPTTGRQCGIVGELAGIIHIAPCPQPATHSTVGTCEQGHTRSRHICARHAAIFADNPDTVFCADCDQGGVESRMTVTINEESTQ